MERCKHVFQIVSFFRQIYCGFHLKAAEILPYCPYSKKQKFRKPFINNKNLFCPKNNEDLFFGQNYLEKIA